VADRPAGPASGCPLHDRLLAGEEAALVELYDRHATLVYRIAVRLLRDPAAAEDVTQEVFVAVWLRPDRFDPGSGTLQAWLAMLARRRAVDAVRLAARQRRRATEQADLRSPPDPAEQAEAGAVTNSLRKAVAALPEAQRRVVLLAYAGGHTTREIAALLGIPLGTAKSRLRLGLRRIAKLLSDDGFLDDR